MRTVTTYINDQIGYKITRPQFLVIFDVGNFSYRYATRKTTNWGGSPYYKLKGLQISFTNNGPNLPESVQVEFLNKNLEFSTSMLQGNLGDAIQVHWSAGNKEILEYNDVVRRFKGVITSMQPSDHNTVILNCDAANFGIGRQYPTIRFSPPYFNNLAVPGERFKWGSRTVIVGE